MRMMEVMGRGPFMPVKRLLLKGSGRRYAACPPAHMCPLVLKLMALGEVPANRLNGFSSADLKHVLPWSPL